VARSVVGTMPSPWRTSAVTRYGLRCEASDSGLS
jgi:hypothetical protein